MTQKLYNYVANTDLNRVNLYRRELYSSGESPLLSYEEDIDFLMNKIKDLENQIKILKESEDD